LQAEARSTTHLLAISQGQSTSRLRRRPDNGEL